MNYLHSYASSIGKIIISSDGEAITGLWFVGQRYFKDTLEGEEKNSDNLPIFKKAERWLDEYFSGVRPSFTPLIHTKGSAFQMLVWEELLSIPYGVTRTYGDIAKAVAKRLNKEKMSAQAVGGAVGKNPISIIIPCHRVIGTDGGLVGYAAGLDKKTALLNLERAVSQK